MQQGMQGQGYLLVDEYLVAPGMVEEDIWYIPGPQTGRGPKNYQRSDERIKEDVSHRLTQHGNLNASDIEVNVKDGVVTLTGTVDSHQAKRMAEKTTDTVPGVKDVQNQLTIQQPCSNSSRNSRHHRHNTRTTRRTRQVAETW
jgi:hypothetical protein